MTLASSISDATIWSVPYNRKTFLVLATGHVHLNTAISSIIQIIVQGLMKKKFYRNLSWPHSKGPTYQGKGRQQW